MNSKITIYKQDKNKSLLLFHEDKNFIVDDLEAYLESRCEKIETEAQYIKIKLDLDIKIAINQTYSHILASDPLYYLKIEEDDQIFYYFIRDFEWLSENSVRLKLHLDVLNTLQLGTDYIFGGETIVKRQHFNRGTHDVDGYHKTVNLYPEGINAPLYKKEETTLHDSALSSSQMDSSFYLMFRNQNDPDQSVNNPVEIYLLPEYGLRVENPENTWAPSWIRAQGGIYLDYSVLSQYYPNTHLWLRIYDGIYRPEKKSQEPFINYWYSGKTPTSSNKDGAIEILRYMAGDILYIDVNINTSSGYLNATVYNQTDGDSGYNQYSITTDGGIIWINVDGETTCLGSIQSSSMNFNHQEEIQYEVRAVRSFSMMAGTSGTINDIDRTDGKIIKILKLPYCPTVWEEIGIEGVYSIPYGFELATLTNPDSSDEIPVLKLTNLNGFSFDRSLTFVEPVNPAAELISSINPSDYATTELDPTSNWAKDLESKLLFSEYSYQRLVYDSGALDLKYEEIETESKSSDFTVRFVNTTTANFRELVMINYDLNYQTDNYDGLLILSRNNELPLYSSDYLDYLRTGYNYDVKSKNLSAMQSATSILTNMFEPGKLANPASMASGAIKGISNTIFSELQAENSLAKTAAEKQYSTESIAGSDDLDLLSVYTDSNKMKMIKYGVHERLESLLVKFFQLSGYACNFYGEPDLDSRTSFNFAQIEPDFEYFRYISRDVINELEEKWRGGIFKLHHFNNDWDDGLDLSNIETSLYN